jgi:hypothetical protein
VKRNYLSLRERSDNLEKRRHGCIDRNFDISKSENTTAQFRFAKIFLILKVHACQYTEYFFKEEFLKQKGAFS